MRLIDRDTMRLIDANALIEALLDARREQTETTLKLIRFIEKQPMIEPKNEGRTVFEESVKADRAVCVYVPVEPKRGQWIVAEDIGDCCYRCSSCGFIRDAYVLDVGNYCPNCGADMRGEQDG